MVHPHCIFDKAEPWTTRIVNIANHFVRKEHNVKLCYFPILFNRSYSPQNINNITVVPLDRTPSIIAFFRNIKHLFKICKWADVVHFQKCHHYASIPVLIAAYISKKPIHYDWDDWEEKIWHESCGNSLHSKFIGISFKILERFIPLLVDSISCASDRLKKMTKQFGVKEDCIFDAPVGADYNLFKPGLDGERIREMYNIKDKLILYIGQLHGAQHADLFIKAANIASHSYHDVSFMIVGEGFMENRLKDLSSDLGLDSKLIFTGAVPHKEIPYYISAADICVASFRETMVSRCKSPLKIAEYLACGKPVVASLVGEVRNMAGGCAILVRPGDFHDLSKAITKLLNDEKLRKDLSNHSRERVIAKYNWNYTSESILNAYNKIVT